MDIQEALTLVRAAGYRVSKPKPKKQYRVGPTCVVVFTDGIVCRMTTYCNDEFLNWKRGEYLCRAAYESRQKLLSPPIKQISFERDGRTIASRAS